MFHQRGATGKSGGEWQPTWQTTRSTKCDYLLSRLRSLNIAPPLPNEDLPGHEGAPNELEYPVQPDVHPYADLQLQEGHLFQEGPVAETPGLVSMAVPGPSSPHDNYANPSRAFAGERMLFSVAVIRAALGHVWWERKID